MSAFDTCRTCARREWGKKTTKEKKIIRKEKQIERNSRKIREIRSKYRLDRHIATGICNAPASWLRAKDIFSTLDDERHYRLYTNDLPVAVCFENLVYT